MPYYLALQSWRLVFLPGSGCPSLLNGYEGGNGADPLWTLRNLCTHVTHTRAHRQTQSYTTFVSQLVFYKQTPCTSWCIPTGQRPGFTLRASSKMSQSSALGQICFPETLWCPRSYRSQWDTDAMWAMHLASMHVCKMATIDRWAIMTYTEECICWFWWKLCSMHVWKLWQLTYCDGTLTKCDGGL